MKDRKATAKSVTAPAPEAADDEILYTGDASPSTAWRAAARGAGNTAQLQLLFMALHDSILWSKAVNRTRCRRCRKGTEPEKMLLCDKCDGSFSIRY
jgi:hypothetical protein